MIYQDIACMFACCYEEGPLPLPIRPNLPFSHMQELKLILPQFFQVRERKDLTKLWFLADMACLAGTAMVSSFVIITS